MPAFARRWQAALLLLGGFFLPLQGGFPAGPAILSLTVLAASRPASAARRPEIWAVALGWACSFLWWGRPGRIMTLIDLALIGPILALAASSPAAPSLRAGLVYGGVFSALALLAQGIIGHHVPLSWLGSIWTWPRASGPFANPNTAGAYLAAIMPLALAGTWRRPLVCLICAILGAACLATGSRGAWLASWAGLAVYLRFRRSPALPLWLLAAAALLILPWPPAARLLAALDGDSAVAARFAIWRVYLQAWLQQPWAGRGMALNPHPHNFLLELAVAGGLPVLAGFAAPAAKAGRLLRVGVSARAAAAAGASLAALLVYGLADAIVVHPALYCLLWLDYGWLTEGGTGYARSWTLLASRSACRSARAGRSRGGLPVARGECRRARLPGGDHQSGDDHAGQTGEGSS